VFKWLAAAFKRDAKPTKPGKEPLSDAHEDLREAGHLAETFFQSQGNPEEFAFGPDDHATLLGFAVIAGLKMEGMPAPSGEMKEELAAYAWEITILCYKVCEPQGAATIVYKRPDLAQNADEDLLVPLLYTCISKGRQMQRDRPLAERRP